MKIVERPGSAASRPPPCSPRPPAVRPCTAQALRAHLGSRRLHARHHLAGQRAPAADYADPEALSTALRGADTLVFVSSDGPVAQVMVHHHNVVRAACASGVAHIVTLSGLDADPCSPFCYAVSYGYTKRLLTASRCLVSIARHRSTASSSPASWPAPAPAARSGSPPPTAGYRWSPALTSRGAWPRSQSGPRAAATTSPALSVSTWLPPQLRRHARGAPRWSMPVSRPEHWAEMATAGEDPWWMYAYPTMFASIREQRWRQSVMSLEHAGPAAAAARRQPDRR